MSEERKCDDKCPINKKSMLGSLICPNCNIMYDIKGLKGDQFIKRSYLDEAYDKATDRIAELEAKLEESLSGTGNLCYECSEHIKSVRLEEENQRLQLKIRQHKYRLKTIKNVCEGDD